jgi:hypothetical protein
VHTRKTDGFIFLYPLTHALTFAVEGLLM